MGRKEVQALLAALISSPLAAQTYNPTLIAPQIIGTPQGMTPLNLGDDNTRAVQLGFSFDYFGKIYTSAWVSSNGFVSFQSSADLCCDGQPMQYAQRNSIYAYWTDLISGPNPYYKPIQDGILFGWYNTKEYGTQNNETFEIALYQNGNIQINYGAVANSYHTVAAGLTGPTSSDNIQLFYGTNVQGLRYQSGLLSLNAPEPVQPASPVAVAPSPAPTVAPNPITATTPTTQAVADSTQAVIQATEVLQNSASNSSAETAQATQTVAAVEDTTNVATTAQTTEQATTATTTTTTTTQETASAAAPDQPLPPGGIPGVFMPMQQTAKPTSEPSQQVAAEAKRDRTKDFFNNEAIEDAAYFAPEKVMLVDTKTIGFLAQTDAQYNQQNGEQKTTELAGLAYSIVPTTEGPTFAASPVTGMGDFSSSLKQNQQLELLNMNGMQTEMAAGDPKDIGDVNSADNQAMVQLASVPEGYSAYTQARIPDMPFYQPKDIYKGRRIPDANLALYRLMRGQDARWDEMTEAQYER